VKLGLGPTKALARQLALGLALALGAAGCSDDRAKDPPAVAAEAQASIYPLDLALRDQDGRPIGLDVFRGHPVIISMFYGTCPAACPLLIAHVKSVESRLDPRLRADTRVLLVSFDPARDTPAVLRATGERHGVDMARWKLATGPDGDVRQLAAALGISYRRMPGGAFAHDSVISVLDGEGRVLARVDDPRAELAPLVAAVARAK
jgi:protein SCO1/2